MTKKTEPAEASDPTSEKNNFQASQLRASRKVRSSTGGFSDDTIWPIVEMHRHNYRVKMIPFYWNKLLKPLSHCLKQIFLKRSLSALKLRGREHMG
jgi:hypothetical protein